MSRKASNPLQSNDSAQDRAARLRCLRAMTGKPRDYYQSHYGIARGTLQNWESARHGGLTEKGANNILKAFKAEKVNCSLAWLLYGIGDGPAFIKDENSVDQHNHLELDVITKEMLYFRESNDNAIDFVVKDHSMGPVYQPGDYVCGCKYYKDQIPNFIDQIVIAQSVEYGTLLRYLKAGSEIGLYSLYSLNVQENFTNHMLLNVEILSVAPIKWHRKPLVSELDIKASQKDRPAHLMDEI